jgi:branched-subunit amino acid aminotransferase/4-amino-4-deoxychorismate lyase
MAHINGAPAALADVQRLALVNYGHFTSIRVDQRHARGLSLHFARLAKDCRALFGVELDLDHVRTLIRNAVADLPDESCVVRVTVFDPTLDLGHPVGATAPVVLVTTRPAGPWPSIPFRIQSTTYSRDYARIKHTGLFGAIACRRLAQLAGYDDALFVDRESHICEGATWNVGFFDGDRVVWPEGDILSGVTMQLLRQAHSATTSRTVRLGDLPSLQAAFATNTTVGVRPVSAIDGIQFPVDHPILETLRKEYEGVPPERV